jgi:hypothetical protein
LFAIIVVVGGDSQGTEGLAGVGIADRISQLAARMHSTMAELVGLAADFDEGHGWDGYGIRSCAHWLAINAGTDIWHGMEMVRVGYALRDLPLLAAAFASGELSFDKLRHVTRVAQAADEGLWLEVARHASGSQLVRICRGFEQATQSDVAGDPEAQLARRGLRTWWRSDGMLELFAVLPPEDGAVVLAALEKVQLGPPTNGVGALRGAEGVVVDPAEDPWAARRADALVEVANQWLAGATTGSPPSPRVVVHVDLASLVGNLDGGCRIEDGPALPAAVARRIGCDTELVAIAERDGAPLYVGRSRRTISARQRLALQARDSTCRFPGCGVPAHRTEGHHLQHWADGGKTDLANLVLLCRFHHHRLHDGAFRIVRGPACDLRFETAGGSRIGRGLLPDARSDDDTQPQPPSDHESFPRALDGGAPCDFAYVVEVLAAATAVAGASRASPGP